MPTTRVLWVVTLLPLLLASRTLRELIEGSMSLHMLLQFPLLLASGATAARLAAGRALPLVAVWRLVDAQGLLGLVTLSVVAAFWMLPIALDAALMHAGAAGCKYASWWIAGWAIALAWPQMPGALRLFLLGNLAWMFFTAGALYAETPQRLCVSYRIDDQVWTGAALCVAGALAVVGLLRLSTRTTAPALSSDLPCERPC